MVVHAVIEERVTLTVPAGQGGRLDQVLPALMTAAGHALSRRAARRSIDAGAVYVDGHRVRVASRRIRTGARIALQPLDAHSERPVFEFEDADILYRDAWVVAVAKPSGVPAQATVNDARNHVEAAVRRYLGRDDKQPYVALHHRLDWGTSGVMILATDRRANAGLAAAFANRTARKRYWALVQGVVDTPPLAWSMRSHLARVVDDRGRWRVGSIPPWDVDVMNGKEATTEFRRAQMETDAVAVSGDIESGGVVTIEAIPHTGRLHQVRAHLAEAGWPVLGDRRYGGAPAPRLMLHAARLALPHPVTGEPLELKCPTPDDFRA